MSFALLRNTKVNRIPFVRYSARTKRENRLTVQLLKDFPQYGVKGEIIEVLPGLMRNKLYPNNGAAYIIPKLGLGPRIPVVKPEKKQPQDLKPIIKSSPKPSTAPKKDVKAFKPVQIEGLLFDLPEGTEATGSITSSQFTYHLLTLDSYLEDIYFKIQPNQSITKADIIKRIGDSTGVVVPQSDISLLKGTQDLEELKEAGQYNVVISQGGKDSITKKINVDMK